MKNIAIILNYNDVETTLKLINLIQNYNSINHMVVVDNNSPDNSYDILKKMENKKITVLRTPNNGGYAYGNNYGLQYAIEKFSPDYFTICNPDINFTEPTIREMINFLDINPKVAAVSPRAYDANGKKDIKTAWKLMSIHLEGLSSLKILGKIIGDRRYYSEEELSKDFLYVDILPGSFFSIRADLFNTLGLFDDSTFLFGEERILGYKIKDAGYESALLGNQSYVHMHGETIKKSIRKQISLVRMRQKSKEYFFKKYLNKNKIELLFLKIFHGLEILELRTYLFIKKSIKSNIFNNRR